MNSKEMAQLLDGREYREEITKAEEALAKDAGLVVVFGYSDDNVELRGVLYDEIGAYEGTEVFVTPNRVLPNHTECECEFCGFEALKKTAKKIEAVWGDKSVKEAWIFKTDIPHEVFNIKEDGEPFCRGIVFSINDL